MIFKRLNRTLAEQIFLVFQANVANIAADDVVGLETNAASVDGIKINQPATALAAKNAVVGVADAAIANGMGVFSMTLNEIGKQTVKVLDTTTSSISGTAAVSVIKPTGPPAEYSPYRF